MVTMVNKKELQRKIQELNFCCVELNLFLDTHPNDSQALQDYKYVLNQLDQLREIYQKNFGSSMNFDYAVVNEGYWNWVSEDELWPWENRRI